MRGSVLICPPNRKGFCARRSQPNEDRRHRLSQTCQVHPIRWEVPPLTHGEKFTACQYSRPFRMTRTGRWTTPIPPRFVATIVHLSPQAEPRPGSLIRKCIFIHERSSAHTGHMITGTELSSHRDFPVPLRAEHRPGLLSSTFAKTGLRLTHRHKTPYKASLRAVAVRPSHP